MKKTIKIILLAVIPGGIILFILWQLFGKKLLSSRNGGSGAGSGFFGGTAAPGDLSAIEKLLAGIKPQDNSFLSSLFGRGGANGQSLVGSFIPLFNTGLKGLFDGINSFLNRSISYPSGSKTYNDNSMFNFAKPGEKLNSTKTAFDNYSTDQRPISDQFLSILSGDIGGGGIDIPSFLDSLSFDNQGVGADSVNMSTPNNLISVTSPKIQSVSTTPVNTPLMDTWLNFFKIGYGPLVTLQTGSAAYLEQFPNAVVPDFITQSNKDYYNGGYLNAVYSGGNSGSVGDGGSSTVYYGNGNQTPSFNPDYLLGGSNGGFGGYITPDFTGSGGF